jgi:hypothetical protein
VWGAEEEGMAEEDAPWEEIDIDVLSAPGATEDEPRAGRGAR